MRRSVIRVALACALVALAAPARAQTVDEVLAKNLDAKGGAENWKGITSVKMTATVTFPGGEAPITLYAKRPNLTRQESLRPDKQRFIQAFDGTTLWAGLAGIPGSTQTAPPAALEMARVTSDFDGPLLTAKANGTTVELVGKEVLDGAETYHLRLRFKNGLTQHSYVDVATGVELKKTQEQNDPQSGRTQTMETVMSDYRVIKGVRMPHKIQQIVNGKTVQQIAIATIEFNVPMDDAMFRVPGK